MGEAIFELTAGISPTYSITRGGNSNLSVEKLLVYI